MKRIFDNKIKPLLRIRMHYKTSLLTYQSTMLGINGSLPLLALSVRAVMVNLGLFRLTRVVLDHSLLEVNPWVIPLYTLYITNQSGKLTVCGLTTELYKPPVLCSVGSLKNSPACHQHFAQFCLLQIMLCPPRALQTDLPIDR